MKRKIIILIIVVVISVGLFYYGNIMSTSRGKIEFSEHLNDVAVTIDDDEILFSDLIFYILFQEQKIEEQARLYNPDNSKDYWNSHTNGEFVEVVGRNAVINMVIHDHIMYKLASEEHIVLSSTEKLSLEAARTDFWNNLYEEQLEKLPLDYEEGNRIMKEIAIIEAYQHDLAKENEGVTYAGLNWEGEDYKKILKEHNVKINKKLWDRVVLGDISLNHDTVNFINGITNDEKEEMKNRKSLRE